MPPTQRLASLFCIVAVGLLAGCQTVGQDFSDFAESLTPKSPSQAARMAIDLNDPDERRRGIVLLSNATFGGMDVYVKLYRDYAETDRDPLVRAAAIRALARHGQPDDAILIAANLVHSNIQVRWEAAKGLQRLHNEEVIPGMLRVMRNEEEEADIRAAIAWGLGQYPQDRVFHALIQALDARELAVNTSARYSLVTLTGQDFALDSSAWLNWYNTALDADDPFSAQQAYLYPTYWRDDSFLDKLMFWSNSNFEQPDAPAGLRPDSERSTYGDDEEQPVVEQ